MGNTSSTEEPAKRAEVDSKARAFSFPERGCGSKDIKVWMFLLMRWAYIGRASLRRSRIR